MRGARRYTPALAIALVTMFSSCDPPSAEQAVSDVSEVTAYFTQCDKGVGITNGVCSGEAHRFGTLIFTVVVSRQLVIPSGAYTYHGCVVHRASAWECLDDKNEGVWMVDGLLHWQHEPATTQLAVPRYTYCATPGLEGSPSPGWFDRRVCERR